MTTKNLMVLGGVAAVLAGAAYFIDSGAKPTAAKLNGKTILPGLNVSDIARLELGSKLTLCAGPSGWTVASLHGYPADTQKIRDNLFKLAELKVGQVARGRQLGATTDVVLKNAEGKEIAKLPLGDKHMGKPTGQMAMYGGGGYPDGRYVGFDGQTVLVKDPLEAFDGDVKKWCNTRIADFAATAVEAVSFKGPAGTVELTKGTNSTWTLKGLAAKEELDSSKTYSLDSGLSYLDFESVADPKLTEAELGFQTGFVYTVVLKEGTNRVTHVAKIGNTVKGASTRYFRLDDGKWTYTISSYAAEKMMKTRRDLVKAKEEPQKDAAADAKKKE
jgi:hypothetical protein